MPVTDPDALEQAHTKYLNTMKEWMSAENAMKAASAASDGLAFSAAQKREQDTREKYEAAKAEYIRLNHGH